MTLPTDDELLAIASETAGAHWFDHAHVLRFARAAIAAHVPEAGCGNIAAVPASLTDEQIRQIARKQKQPPWGIGSRMPDAIEFARAVLAAVPARSSSPDFTRRTNEDYIAWCATFYNPDALDEKGMQSLHGLWAWQEQERRKQAAPAQRQPHKIQIPPPPADLTDVCYAEGWNACCDAFFGSKPMPEPLVITITNEVTAQRQPLTPEARSALWYTHWPHGNGWGNKEWYAQGVEDAEQAHGITAAPAAQKGE